MESSGFGFVVTAVQAVTPAEQERDPLQRGLEARHG
jgi:hypothetical protein